MNEIFIVEEVVKRAQDLMSMNSPGNACNLRLGQSYFLALMDVDEEIAHKIIGTDDDCFYSDKRIDKFFAKIVELKSQKIER